MNNIINTNCNNLVTIDNNYVSQTVSNSRRVRYDNVLDPNKPHSTTSDSHSTSFILPRMDLNIYFSNILTCTPIRNILSNLLIAGSSINFITVLSKFWRRSLISITQYFTTMLTKICTFSSHLTRV